MAKVISTTYGEALFELAKEQGRLDDFEEQVTLLSQAFAENPELMKLLNHPQVTKEEKISIVENIFRGRVDDDIVGFLVIIVEKGRFAEVEDIFGHFHAKVLEHNHIGVAHVASAAELSAEQKKQIEQKLLAQTSYQSFLIDYTVDAALLGGMVIRIGDRVMDASVRTRLENMTKELRKISLA